MKRAWPVITLILFGCTGETPRPAAPETVTLAAPLAVSVPRPPAAEQASTHACPGGAIPNTDVCDTPENRDVLDVCEAYRTALEARNVERILRLASKDYFDDGGNADASDDLGRAGLEAYLRGQFANIDALRYEVRYRKIELGPTIRVTVTYSASYKIGPDWKRNVSDNILELRREDGKLLIVGGM